jgi:preprotein translocase subunit SecE
MSVMMTVKGVYRYFVEVRKMLPGILFPQLSHAGQKILVVIFRHFKKKYVCNCNPYFIVVMITVLIMIGIFWVVNFKTRNYFVIVYYTERLSQVIYVPTTALILFIHVRFLEYLSFKRFKLIDRITISLSK